VKDLGGKLKKDQGESGNGAKEHSKSKSYICLSRHKNRPEIDVKTVRQDEKTVRQDEKTVRQDENT